eukprot:2162630-Lingulodinium_polyedra.AAC.1
MNGKASAISWGYCHRFVLMTPTTIMKAGCLKPLRVRRTPNPLGLIETVACNTCKVSQRCMRTTDFQVQQPESHTLAS